MIRKQASIVFLKAVLVLMGAAVLALCIFWLPGVAGRDAAAHPETAYLQYPFLACAYVLCVPLFTVLYQSFKLLSYVARNQASSELSFRALKVIQYCAIAVCLAIALGIMGVIGFAKGEDITGVMMLGLLCVLASSVVAALANVLQQPFKLS